MKNKICSILVCFLPVFWFSVNCFCQNQTLEKLNAQKINYAILFRIEKIAGVDQLTYEIDPRDAALNEHNTARSKPIGNIQAPLHLASTSSAFNVLFSFYNPLKYRYKIGVSETIDPSSLAFEKFYSSVLDLAKILNPQGIGGSYSNSIAETVIKSYETDNYWDYRIMNLPNSQPQNSPTKITRIKSNELIDWVLWYFQNINKYGTVFNVTNKTILQDLLENKYQKAEEYLYDKIDGETAEALTGNKSVTLYFESFVADLLEKLRGAESRTEFDLQLKKITNSLAQLKGYNDNASKLCDTIEGIEIKEGKNNDEKYFIDYTKNKRSIYVQKVRSIIKSRVGLIDNFNSLVSDITSNFLPTIAANNATKEYAIKTKLGAIVESKIQIIKSNYVVENGLIKRNEDKTYEFNVIVSEYTSLVAEFGLGTILFPSIDADNFTSSNNTIVKTSSKIFFTPMASLNLIPNISKGQAFWMLQLGVGSNIDKPAVALGTGVRIYNVRESAFRNFSITFGAVSCFVKKLDKLSEGITADQSTLERDQYFAPIFRPYVGIQINF